MADLLERMKKEMLSFSVMFVGISGAGKSSLILRYADNTFVDTLQSTVGIDFRNKKLKYKQKTVNLELWDTSGQEVYKSISNQRYKRSNAVIFVYDLTQPKSIEDLEKYWIPTAVSECPLGTIFAVFGNKSDLVRAQNPQKIHEIDELVTQKLRNLQSKLSTGFMHFIGNCKEDQDPGIPEMMTALTEALYQKNEKQQSKIEEDKRLAKQQGMLEQPVRKSVVLCASDFESNSIERKKPKRKCLPF